MRELVAAANSSQAFDLTAWGLRVRNFAPGAQVQFDNGRTISIVSFSAHYPPRRDLPWKQVRLIPGTAGELRVDIAERPDEDLPPVNAGPPARGAPPAGFLTSGDSLSGNRPGDGSTPYTSPPSAAGAGWALDQINALTLSILEGDPANDSMPVQLRVWFYLPNLVRTDLVAPEASGAGPNWVPYGETFDFADYDRTKSLLINVRTGNQPAGLFLSSYQLIGARVAVQVTSSIPASSRPYLIVTGENVP